MLSIADGRLGIEVENRAALDALADSARRHEHDADRPRRRGERKLIQLRDVEVEHAREAIGDAHCRELTDVRK